MIRRLTVLVGSFAVLFAATSPAWPDELDPYRKLAASPAGARLLASARSAIERYWSKEANRFETARGAPEEWPGRPVALFVSLLRGRETRACVGTPEPIRGSLDATVRALAVDALRSDRRHPPVRRDEIARLRIAIAFASPGEVLEDPMRVDPGKEGLLIGSPRGDVAFLPGEGRTVRWALGEARRIGVLVPSAGDATFRRLRVVTLVETGPRIDRRTDEGD